MSTRPTSHEILARIRDAVEASLAKDPDDWAAAGAAAERASKGRYLEVPVLVDRCAGDGRTVSAGSLDDRPVAIEVDGGIRDLDLVEVRFRDPDTGDWDSDLYVDSDRAEDAAAYWHGQGYEVEVFDLLDPDQFSEAARVDPASYRDLKLHPTT